MTASAAQGQFATATTPETPARPCKEKVMRTHQTELDPASFEDGRDREARGIELSLGGGHDLLLASKGWRVRRGRGSKLPLRGTCRHPTYRSTANSTRPAGCTGET